MKVLSFRVRLGWGGKHAEATQRQRFSAIDPDAEDDTPDFEPDLAPAAGSGFQTPDHRKLASAQIEAFEGQPSYQGAAFREIARGLLAARDWKAAAFEAQLVGHAGGISVAARGALFDAIAERVLRQLTEHRFTHWPEDADLVLNPMATAMGIYLTEQPARVVQPADAPDRLSTCRSISSAPLLRGRTRVKSTRSRYGSRCAASSDIAQNGGHSTCSGIRLVPTTISGGRRAVPQH